MTVKEAMKQLREVGSAQNRKVYGRHGVSDNMFGVSYANLGKLKRKVGVDHDLALQLWETGNHDARVLATMIADPEQMESGLIDAWVKDLDNYPVTDAFAELVGRTPHAQKKMEKWSNVEEEWVGRAGWKVLAHLAMSNEELSDAYLENYLGIICEDIHNRKNRVREAMNSALIAIGIRNDKLKKKGLAAAKVIGKVHVDHGQTSCKTPDAASYIAKVAGHRASKAGPKAKRASR